MAFRSQDVSFLVPELSATVRVHGLKITLRPTLTSFFGPNGARYHLGL